MKDLKELIKEAFDDSEKLDSMDNKLDKIIEILNND